MSAQGINYYFSGIGLPYDIWEASYYFSGVRLGSILSTSGAKSANSGVCSPSYTISNDRGLFNGSQIVSIPNATGDLSSWTIILDFEKNSPQEGVLFSNLSASGVLGQVSGFSLGVSATNKVFFESYNSDGVINIVSNIELANRNLMSISKAGNGLYVDYFNANTKDIISEKFEIGDLCAINSNKWILGGTSGTNSWATTSAFSGYVYSFNLFSDSLRPDEIKSLIYGNASDVVGNTTVFNTGYLTGLGMNRISYFNPLDSFDTIESYVITGVDNFANVNKSTVYDTVQNEFFGSDSSSSVGVYPYINGVSQYGSNVYFTSGTFYDTTYTLSGQFVPSGTMIFTDKNYSVNDICYYDINTLLNTGAYHQYGFSHNGSSNTDIDISDSSYFVFFNGVKLVSGYDYTGLSASTIRFASGNDLYNGVSGLLHVAPAYSNEKYYLSDSGVINISATFARSSSMIYENGARQIPNDDYIESSSIGMMNEYLVSFPTGAVFTSNFNFISPV